jgi:hypothetical protein
MLPDNLLDDARQCIAQLERIDADFTELLNMYKGKPLFNEDRRPAQEKLRLLKELLASEAKRLETAKRKEDMSYIEETCYYPAVLQTKAELNMPWNSIPDGKWHALLYGSQVSITDCLFKLRDEIPK